MQAWKGAARGWPRGESILSLWVLRWEGVGGPLFVLCSTSSRSSSIPWEWDSPEQQDRSPQKPAVFVTATGLLPLAGPGLLVLPVKSLEV